MGHLDGETARALISSYFVVGVLSSDKYLLDYWGCLSEELRQIFSWRMAGRYIRILHGVGASQYFISGDFMAGARLFLFSCKKFGPPSCLIHEHE